MRIILFNSVGKIIKTMEFCSSISPEINQRCTHGSRMISSVCFVVVTSFSGYLLSFKKPRTRIKSSEEALEALVCTTLVCVSIKNWICNIYIYIYTYKNMLLANKHSYKKYYSIYTTKY